MEEYYDFLIEALEANIAENGEKPLTNKQLLNIFKTAREQIDIKNNAIDCDFNPYWD